MRIVKLFLMMLCLGLFVLSVPLTAKADEWDKKTTLTFNKPVEVPGIVLAPGTYVFKLVDLASNRNVVEIFNGDESHFYEYVMAIPTYRLEPSEKTVVTFEERAAGMPPAINTWFYPGDNYGEEFLYPSVTAAAVAAVPPEKTIETPAKATVTPPEVRSKPVAPEKQMIKPIVPAEQPATTASVPKTEPVQIAQATTPPTPTAPPATATVTVPKKLPKTASSVPLVILIGLLSLGASAGVHVFSKRSI